MRDSKLSWIIIAKNHIKLLELYIVLVHYAPYRAGPKTREVKKAKNDNVLAEYNIDSAQTK